MTEHETLSNVEKALNEIRPFLMSDGGNIKLLSIEGVVVKVQLEGACTGCSVNQMDYARHVQREQSRWRLLQGFDRTKTFDRMGFS